VVRRKQEKEMNIQVTEENKINVCKKCKNYGYYEVKVRETQEIVQWLCACPIGQHLKQMKIKWELEIINQIATDTHARLRIIKNNLHEPTKASKFIDTLLEDIEKLQKKTQKALENPQ